MDINFLRSTITIMSFIAFIGILIWTLRSTNRERFAEAARLPFMADEEKPHE
jgi:cytochrome c oxidase cbb3-type subunit 4